MALSRDATKKVRPSTKKASSAGGSSRAQNHMHATVLAAPRCSQCGRQLPGVPFALANLVCRQCYGLERYPTLIPEHETPEKL